MTHHHLTTTTLRHQTNQARDRPEPAQVEVAMEVKQLVSSGGQDFGAEQRLVQQVLMPLEDMRTEIGYLHQKPGRLVAVGLEGRQTPTPASVVEDRLQQGLAQAVQATPAAGTKVLDLVGRVEGEETVFCESRIYGLIAHDT